MGLLKGMGIMAAVAAAGIAVFARKRSAETGRDIKDVITNLPEEMAGTTDGVKERLKGAAGEFRKASKRREEEIDQLLAEEEARLEAASRLPEEQVVPVQDV